MSEASSNNIKNVNITFDISKCNNNYKKEQEYLYLSFYNKICNEFVNNNYITNDSCCILINAFKNLSHNQTISIIDNINIDFTKI